MVRTKRTGESVVLQIEPGQCFRLKPGNRTGQFIVAEHEVDELRQSSDRRRNFSGELVVAEINGPKLPETPQPPRNLAGEKIPVDAKKP